MWVCFSSMTSHFTKIDPLSSYSKNMISSENATAILAADGGSTVANLTTSIRSDLNYLRKSFQRANQNIDQLIAQTDEAFNKLAELVPPESGGEARATDDLRLLQQSVSKLKSKIPSSLMNLYPDDHQYANPNLHLRPRSYDPKSVKSRSVHNPMKDFNFNQPPTSVELESSLESLNDESKDCLLCFLVFPENAIIKRSLVFYWVKAHCSCSVDFSEVIHDVIAKGFINPVYKEGNLGVSGYWMHPFVRSTLNDSVILKQPLLLRQRHLLGSLEMDDDIIYSDSLREFTTMKEMRFLHLGKWQRSSEQHGEGQFEQHIEVVDPKLFFKDMKNMNKLRYISLGGISMITELPEFITELKGVEVLDLKACYNLEVIPPGIANLSRSLTHLDMSECYFLDHMPVALASLHSLKVLKGFFVGETTKTDSCSLHHLIALQDLVKLNIYTSVKEFPNVEQLTIIQEFKALRNLTISWGGCSILRETETSRLAVIAATRHRGFLKRMDTNVGGKKAFSFMLEKLDLQCVPEMVTRSWLNPYNFENLKKLYIRGGPFYDIGQLWDDSNNEDSVSGKEWSWNVAVLRLKYLRNLEMDWTERERLFPKLLLLEKVKCPNLNRFPDDGFWINETEPDH